MWAKFISETVIEPAPPEIELDDRKYVGFTSEFLLAQGYKPVEFTLRSESGIYDKDNNIDHTDITYECYYTEESDKIVQGWRVC